MYKLYYCEVIDKLVLRMHEAALWQLGFFVAPGRKHNNDEIE